MQRSEHCMGSEDMYLKRGTSAPTVKLEPNTLAQCIMYLLPSVIISFHAFPFQQKGREKCAVAVATVTRNALETTALNDLSTPGSWSGDTRSRKPATTSVIRSTSTYGASIRRTRLRVLMKMLWPTGIAMVASILRKKRTMAFTNLDY